MDTRELVILFVGFAIVWVLLRGLYVALQARRGQIRLAIDKNIPQDVDLDALEMTELPSGGARVVARTLEEVNIQNRAHETFEGVGDDENELVPILTDTVELSNPNEAGSENAESENYLGNHHEPDRHEEAEWEEFRDNEFSDRPEQVSVEAAESSEYDE